MPFNQTVIFEHYRQHHPTQARGWSKDPEQWPISGIRLAERILPGERVLDIGCATNVFKGLIPGVVGIDPAYEAADYQCRIEDFYPEQPFDVAFALSVLHWGTHADIEQQMTAMVRCLRPKSRIYLRLNQEARGGGNWGTEIHPRQHDQYPVMKTEDCRPYYWTEHRVRWWADHMGYAVTELCWDYNAPADRRQIFTEWRRG